MQTRIVKDIAYWADGSRAAAQTVTFVLDDRSFTATELVLPKTVSVTTNHLGEFSATLWCNGEGSRPTRWVCTLPAGDIIRFVLPPGTGDVTLRSLLAVTGALTTSEAVLYAKLDGRYALKGEAGGGSGVTDHGQLSGLGDDDHPQYLTPLEGDARYSLAGHNHDASYAATGHTHDTRYYTETEVDGLLANKASTTHNHDSAYAALGHNHTGVYDPAGTASTALTNHTNAADPHPQYLTQAEGDARYALQGQGGGGGGPVTRHITIHASSEWQLSWAVPADLTDRGIGIRVPADLTGCTEVRFLLGTTDWQTVPNVKLVLQYAPFGSGTWTDLAECSIGSGGGDSGWATLPAGAQGPVVLRYAGKGGDGTSGYSFGPVVAWVR